MQERDMALKNIAYKIRTGSKMYGTDTKESDDDFAGIFIPDKDYVLGIKKIEQVELTQKLSKTKRNSKGDVDYTIYAITKFIPLAIANNPNIIEFLYAPRNCQLFTSEYSDELIENRNWFLSKKAYHTFKGYAYSQRQKLLIKKENMTGRTEIVEKYGWDVKFGSHLIRLLLECLEILTEKTISFPLRQNNLVRDIKLGNYELEWVLNKASEIEKLIDIAYVQSDLQHSSDLKNINELQMFLLEAFWKAQD